MISSDQAPAGADWLARRVTDLERQVRELQAGRRLEAATIGGGGLTIKGGTLQSQYANGVAGLHVGPHETTTGVPVRGVIMRRPTGALALWLWGRDSDGQGFWAWYDEAGNIIFSDDSASGQGLARPWIPYTAMRTADFVTPPASTTSGTFTPLWTVNGVKQHPKIRVSILTQSDAATTGEVQLKDTLTGAVIAGPVSIPAGDNTYPRDLDGTIAGDFSSYLKVDIEARRTAGAGAIRVAHLHTMGRQT